MGPGRQMSNLNKSIMGKLQKGINDGFRGTIGTAVGYEWRGQWCMRSRPCRVRNPRSMPQVESRRRLSLSSRLAARMGDALRVGLRNESMSRHLTECNLFLSLNKSSLALDGDTLNIDYSSLCVSVGPVAPVEFGEPAIGLEGVVTVQFDKNPLEAITDSHDHVYLYAYCPTLERGQLSIPGYRYHGYVHIALPSEWAGHKAHLYGFVRANSGECSVNSHIGCVEC